MCVMLQWEIGHSCSLHDVVGPGIRRHSKGCNGKVIRWCRAKWAEGASGVSFQGTPCAAEVQLKMP